MFKGTRIFQDSPLLSMAACLPSALVLTALLEALRPTLGWSGPAAVLRTWVFSQALRWSYEPLASGLALYVALLLLASLPQALLRRWLRYGIGVAMTVVVTLFQYNTLIEYQPFVGYWPFRVLALAYFVFLAVGACFLVRAGTGRPSGPMRLLYASLAAASLAGWVLCTAVNFTYLLRLYPTLHLCLYQVSFTLLCMGLLLLSAIPSQSPRGQRLIHLCFFYPGLVSLTLVLLSPLAQASPVAEAYFRHYTTPGEYRVQTAPRVDIHAGIVRAPVRLDRKATARFARHSGFPRLPADFRVADYNVLFVTVDAVRYDKTSLHDRENGHTPSLLRLADSGAFSFSWAFSPSAGTYQSIASLFSMTYPSAVRYCLRERAWAGWIPPGPAWVPKLFQNAGYATFWTGYDGNAGTFSRQIRGFQHGFSSWRLSPKSGRDRQYELAADVEIAQMAIEEIDRAVARQTRFFGWVFFVSPHDDYVAHYDGRPADTMEHRYEQEIRFSDENLGRLIDHIRERRLLQETIVIVASDHGEEFYEHGGQQHRSSLYNEQTRVPLVVRIPHVEGEFVETPTSLIYLFPWLLQHGTAAMREMARQRLEGDIGPMLRATDGAVVLEIVGLDKHYAGLIHGNKKLIFNFHSQLFELYDLGRDPGERQNLALSRPAEMQSFRARFESYLRVQRGNQRAVLCRDVAWH